VSFFNTNFLLFSLLFSLFFCCYCCYCCRFPKRALYFIFSDTAIHGLCKLALS